jgi:hypothetical protein
MVTCTTRIHAEVHATTACVVQPVCMETPRVRADGDELFDVRWHGRERAARAHSAAHFRSFPIITAPPTTSPTTPVIYPFDLASAVDRPYKSRDAFESHLDSKSFAAVSRPGNNQPTVVAIGPAPLAMSVFKVVIGYCPGAVGSHRFPKRRTGDIGIHHG